MKRVISIIIAVLLVIGTTPVFNIPAYAVELNVAKTHNNHTYKDYYNEYSNTAELNTNYTIKKISGVMAGLTAMAGMIDKTDDIKLKDVINSLTVGELTASQNGDIGVVLNAIGNYTNSNFGKRANFRAANKTEVLDALDNGEVAVVGVQGNTFAETGEEQDYVFLFKLNDKYSVMNPNHKTMPFHTYSKSVIKASLSKTDGFKHYVFYDNNEFSIIDYFNWTEDNDYINSVENGTVDQFYADRVVVENSENSNYSNPSATALNGFSNNVIYWDGFSGRLDVPEMATRIADASDNTPETGAFSASNSKYGEINTEIDEINAPSQIKSIGSYAFFGLSNVSKVTATGARSIGEYAFANCLGLTEVSVSGELDKVGKGAFSGCDNLESLYFENENCEIYDDESTIPASVKIYGVKDSTAQAYATKYNRTFEVKYPEHEHIFNEKIILTEPSWSHNGESAYRCSICEKVDETTKALEFLSGSCGENAEYTFDAKSGLLTISGTGEMSDYLSESSPFSKNEKIKKVVINNGITKISRSAFENSNSITEIHIADTVVSIEYAAFKNCGALEEINLPQNSGFTYIKEILEGCKKLKNIVIPDQVTDIGRNAFKDCDGLNEINIPANVSAIDEAAFHHCTGLERITVDPVNDVYESGDSNAIIDKKTKTLILGCNNTIIPDGVKIIGKNAFFGCDKLESIVLPDSVTDIEDHAFEDCTALYEINLSENISNLGMNVFSGCVKLKNVIIPQKVTRINENAFATCSDLERITISAEVESIDPNAFDGAQNVTICCIDGTAASDFAESHNDIKSEIIIMDVLEENEEEEPENQEVRRAFSGRNAAFKDDVIKSYTYTGKKIVPKVVVKDKNTNEPLKRNVDFRVDCSKYNNTNVKDGGSVLIEGMGKYKGINKTIKFNIKPVSVNKGITVTLSSKTFKYNGKVKTPKVVVKYKGKMLNNGSDYSVKLPSGSKNIGKYTVTVIFKGNYSGTKTDNYQIVPQTPSKPKVKSGKKSMDVSWKAKKNISGYKIQYSTNKSFTKGVKTVSAGAKATDKTIKGLKSKKKYYVRILTYKKVGGKTYFSNPSKVKAVKIK